MCLGNRYIVMKSGDSVEFVDAELGTVPDQIMLPACDLVETNHGDAFTITPLSPESSPGLFEIAVEQPVVINTTLIAIELKRAVKAVKARWATCLQTVA